MITFATEPSRTTTRHESLEGLKRHINIKLRAGYTLIGYGYEGSRIALHWGLI